jgi:hypothetical protein
MVKFVSWFSLLVFCLLSVPAMAQTPKRDQNTAKPASSILMSDSLSDPDVAPVEDTTLNKLLDEEAAKLPFLRRRIAQRLLADDEDREKIVERVTLKLAENKRLKPMQSTFASEEFTGDTPMQLSPELKQIIMDLLKQLLPMLLALIFKV